MIEARAVTKTYRRHLVLDQAQLRVDTGSVVVLSGDNGSGKTTLLHVLVGLRRVDAGSVWWQGENLSAAGRRSWLRAREQWGFLPQRTILPPGASVDQVLRFYARLRRTTTEDALAWLARLGLADNRRQRVETLSGGMQQRLGIALTLAGSPRLVVMDEPASSLDPDWRDTLARILLELARQGTGVLVTSQMEQAWPGEVRRLHCEAGQIVAPQEDAGSC